MSNPYAPPRPGHEADGPQDARPGDDPSRPASEDPARPPDGREPALPQVVAGQRPVHSWTSASRPPQPPPDPQLAAAAAGRVPTVALLMLATLVAATRPLPWQLGALAFGTAALVTGIRAIMALARAGLARGLLVMMLTGGMAFTSLTVLGVGSGLTRWSIQMDHQRCVADALTISAQDACAQRYQDALSSRLLDWRSLLSSPSSKG